jgi:uncharacterized membrane protein YhhN
MRFRVYVYIFLLLLVSDLLSIGFGWQAGHYVAKFLLMPVLLTGMIQSKRSSHEKNWRVILAGLVLAWAGDVLLLFSATRPIFFILGLVCFLCTHLSYIIYFWRYNNALLGYMTSSPLIASVVILFALLLLSLLWPHLGGLLLPVIVYTAVITTMVLQALAAGQVIQKPVSTLFISGAIFFIISDSLLAINKFYEAFFAADILVMATYGAAQLLIVYAAFRNHDQHHFESSSSLVTN